MPDRADRSSKYVETVLEISRPLITGEVPEAMLALAMGDLETRTNAARAEFKVLQTSFEEWPDGGMGCASPGETYTLAPVRGYKVVLVHAGMRYDYRLSEGGQIRLCRAGRTPRNTAPTQ